MKKNKKPIDVIWFYEHVDREVDIACAVKALIEEQYGLHIEVVQHPYGEMVANYQHLRPKVILLPSVLGSYIPYLLEWPTAICVNLRWEQIFYKGIQGNKVIKGSLARQNVIHHAWSDFTLAELHNQGVPKTNIYLNGNPVYSLYQPPFQQYFTPRRELAQRYGLDENKAWLFFPENYKWAFFSEDEIRRKEKPEEKMSMRQYCLASLCDVLGWCAELARSGLAEVIIRPRPFTPLETFRKFTNTVINIPEHLYILKDESVREWILASNLVVSAISTSLIEAAVARKPTYILEPYPSHPLLHMPWQDLLPRIKNSADLICAIQNHQSENQFDALGQWAQTQMMSHGDPLLNLARFIVDLVQERIPPPPRPVPQNFEFVPVGRLPTWLLYNYHKYYRRYERLRRRLNPRPFKLPPTNEKDFISANELQGRLDRWKQLIPHDV